jgi:hypothetical protein
MIPKLPTCYRNVSHIALLIYIDHIKPFVMKVINPHSQITESTINPEIKISSPLAEATACYVSKYPVLPSLHDKQPLTCPMTFPSFSNNDTRNILSNY